MTTIEARQSATFKSARGREFSFYRDAPPVRKCGPMMLWRLLLCMVWIGAGKCIIQDRDNPDRIGPLRPRHAQIKMFDSMLDKASKREKIRQNVPKSRRHGASTAAQAVFEFMCKVCLSRNALTVAHSEEQVREIFQIARRIAAGVANTQPSNKAERNIRFDSTGSVYRCLSGMANYAGSGSTIHFLHISEYAKFTNTSDQDKTALRSMINAMSQTSLDTIVIIESSGEGPEGDWPDRVRGVEEDDDNEFVNVFLPWTDDPANSADPDEVPEDFLERLGKHEQELLTRGLTLEQIYWRHRKIKSEYPGEDPGERVIAFGYDWPLDLEDLFGIKQGRVYPMLKREVHEREVEFKDLSNAAYRIRITDWGATKENPFATGFFYVDPERAPGFTASKKCTNFWSEATQYAYDKKGKPIDKFNHLLDGVRMLVTTLQLDCYVHMYEEIYISDFDDEETALPDLARQIHQLSGWEHPFETHRDAPEWQDLRLYKPRTNGARFETGIADRSGTDRIRLFNRWGLPTRAHVKTTDRDSKLSEIEDGIAQVATLMRGTIANPDGPKFVNEALRSAIAKVSGGGFRPQMMTPEEEEAYKAALADSQFPATPTGNDEPFMEIDGSEVWAL